MITITTRAKCPVCQDKNKLSAEKPKLFATKFASYKCETCESTIHVKLLVTPKTPKGEVFILPYRVEHSDLAKRMLAEEKAEKEKDPENDANQI